MSSAVVLILASNWAARFARRGDPAGHRSKAVGMRGGVRIPGRWPPRWSFAADGVSFETILSAEGARRGDPTVAKALAARQVRIDPAGGGTGRARTAWRTRSRGSPTRPRRRRRPRGGPATRPSQNGAANPTAARGRGGRADPAGPSKPRAYTIERGAAPTPAPSPRRSGRCFRNAPQAFEEHADPLVPVGPEGIERADALIGSCRDDEGG